MRGVTNFLAANERQLLCLIKIKSFKQKLMADDTNLNTYQMVVCRAWLNELTVVLRRANGLSRVEISHTKRALKALRARTEPHGRYSN